MQYSEIYKYISIDDGESREAFIKDFEEELIELSKIFSDAFN